MRKKLIELLDEITKYYRFDAWENSDKIADFLIANDVVPVVRCRDCKHAGINENHTNKPLICYLTRMCGTVKPDWYCWQGERKDNGKDNN